MKNFHRYKKLILFILLFIVFIILLLLPKDFFDHGKSICLSVVLFNKKCYACGLTRATQHFIHFDFINAIKFNKLIILTFPLLVFLLLYEFYKTIKELKNK